MIASHDPSSGELVRTFSPHSDAEVETRVAAAVRAAELLRALPIAQRAAGLRRLADRLAARREELAGHATLEMGKLLGAARAEIDKCAEACRTYAERGPDWLADEPVATDAHASFIRYEPLGPVLAVMPWNFPYWQVFRFAAPALLAGNPGLLKHASNVPQCALAIESVIAEAGFPAGSFQTLLIEARRVAGLLDDPRIRAATLTGSEAAGRSLATAAGRNLKRVVLELGGSDPFVVLPSADVAKAVEVGVAARVQNAGQSCIAAKRFIVHASVYAQFEQLFVARMAALVVGDPREAATQVGPLASEQVLRDVEDQIQRSVAAGARLRTGGRRLDRPGYFLTPTVLVDVPRNAAAAREEVFGPVAALFKVGSLEQAIELANDTPFGLGACAFTRDPAERALFTDQLQAGSVFIDGMVKSDPRLPFGGIKTSGYGRELSAQGMREFCNIKTVWVGDAPDGSSQAHSAQGSGSTADPVE